jgi:hypothetical protein
MGRTRKLQRISMPDTNHNECVRARLLQSHGALSAGLFGRARLATQRPRSRVITLSSNGMARETGLEPAASAVTGRRSNQLSYSRIPIRNGR